MKFRALLAAPVAVVAAGLLLSACAGPSQIAGTASVSAAAAVAKSSPVTGASTPVSSVAAAAEAPAPAAPPVVGVAATGDLGEVLVAANGLTLYAFTKDVDGVSTCFDACATAWPAVTVDEGFAVASGLDAAIFTTVDRPDGTKQLKAGKWPLYFYAGDGAPGETNGQGVSGVWFAVTTEGKLKQPGAPAPESPAAAPAPAPAPAAAPAPAPAAAAGPVVQLAPVGNLGEVMVGANGNTLYAFTNDPAGQTTCFDACATAWPPLLVDPGFVISDELAATGAATITRPDGTTQLVMGPWALYYYAGDGAPGEANGQGQNDKWFAVDANCKLVRTAA
jgi:predicted lipoprotein with Yx(FWY)xxD motif